MDTAGSGLILSRNPRGVGGCGDATQYSFVLLSLSEENNTFQIAFRLVNTWNIHFSQGIYLMEISSVVELAATDYFCISEQMLS